MKITRREHLKVIEKQTGAPQPELQGPPLPSEVAHIWGYFIELHSGRSYGMGGPHPLAYSEIESFSRLMHRHLDRWEVQAIKKLDQLWIQHYGK